MYHPEGKTATKQKHVENRNPLKIMAETNKKVGKKSTMKKGLKNISFISQNKLKWKQAG